MGKEKTFLLEIKDKFYRGDGELAIQEIRKINMQFRNKLKVNNDFIIHLNTSGYSINRDDFQIQP